VASWSVHESAAADELPTGGPTDTSTGVEIGRALWFTGPRTAELVEEEVPPPGPGQVRVRSTASLVSAGTEMIQYRGQAGSRLESDLPTSAGQHPFPIKFAYQTVGQVEAVGAGVEFEVGDRVFAYHPHQDVFTMHAGPVGGGILAPGGRRLLFAVPETLDTDRAVFANLYSVALTCLLDVPVRVGDCTVVSGLGIVGAFCAEMARQTAGKLIVVDPLPSRRARASWIGADAVVDPADAAVAIEEHSSGRGADVYIEASGAPAALQAALRGTGREGTIAVVAYYGKQPVTLTLAPEFHLRRQRIVSSQNASIGSGLQPRWDTERRMGVAMARLERIDVSRLITHRYPFQRAPEAYRLLDEATEDALAVILEYRG
jgi:2-desacetyl-2-hydroxyethyl bacteriochlorophyllide A dehydrogenase